MNKRGCITLGSIKKLMIQLLIIVILVTTLSAVMIGIDFNNMMDDIENGNYEVYNGEYADFTEFGNGVTVADNGAVSRTSYLGYVNNIIVDNDFIDKGNNRITEDDAVLLSEIKPSFIARMVVAQAHFFGAVLMFVLYKFVIQPIIYYVYKINKLVLSRDYTEDNILKVNEDTKEFISVFNNKHLMYLDILYISISTYIIRISINLGRLDFIMVMVATYVIIALINYMFERKIKDRTVD